MINRGITIEGFGVLLAGLFGTGTGITSFSENIAIVGITRVASRRVCFYFKKLIPVYKRKVWIFAQDFSKN